jgi:hypothetical protein
MDIKAIETNYKGYKFRSRLEARWAVFFDTAEIKWEYEPEGFEMSNGQRYLPDFYLPEEQAYFEIKGVMPDETYMEKLKLFAIEKDITIVLVVGICGEGECYHFTPTVGRWRCCFIVISPYFVPNYKNGRLGRMVFILSNSQNEEEENLKFLARDFAMKIENERKKAIKAMKQARFEFL